MLFFVLQNFPGDSQRGLNWHLGTSFLIVNNSTNWLDITQSFSIKTICPLNDQLSFKFIQIRYRTRKNKLEWGLLPVYIEIFEGIY